MNFSVNCIKTDRLRSKTSWKRAVYEHRKVIVTAVYLAVYGTWKYGRITDPVKTEQYGTVTGPVCSVNGRKVTVFRSFTLVNDAVTLFVLTDLGRQEHSPAGLAVQFMNWRSRVRYSMCSCFLLLRADALTYIFSLISRHFSIFFFDLSRFFVLCTYEPVHVSHDRFLYMLLNR